MDFRLYLNRQQRNRQGNESAEAEYLQTKIDSQQKYKKERYSRRTHLTGASPSFRPQIHNSDKQPTSRETGGSLKNKLQKKHLKPEEDAILQTIDKYRERRDASVWISKSLSADLNLPVKKKCPVPNAVQCVALIESKPAIVLTLYRSQTSDDEKEEVYGSDSERENVPYSEGGQSYSRDRKRKGTAKTQNGKAKRRKTHQKETTESQKDDVEKKKRQMEASGSKVKPGNDQVESSSGTTGTEDESEFIESLMDFTVETAQKLTTHLHDFCYCDFMLVPCVLPYETFSLESLQEEVNKQLKKTYFSGPKCLKKSANRSLKAAAEAVSSVTYVPYFIPEEGSNTDGQMTEQPWLLHMDDKWSALRSGFTEILTERKIKQLCLTYTDKTEYKAKVALLEAVRRLSFSEKVVIVTSDKRLVQKKWQLENYTGKEHRPEMDIEIRESRSQGEPSEALHVYIDFDVPPTEEDGASRLKRGSSTDIKEDKEGKSQPRIQTRQSARTGTQMTGMAISPIHVISKYF